MKSAVLLSLLVCQTLAAPTLKEPLAFVKKAVAFPVEALKSVLPSLPSFDGELLTGLEHEPEVTHELISLSEYPVWRLHHFNKVELIPVPLAELDKTPVASLVPTEVAAEYAPPVEVLPLQENPSEAFYGEDEQVDMGRLSFLGPILGAASGVREAVTNMRNFVVGIPKSVLGFMGLTEEEEVEGLPAVPEINIPALPSKALPALPVKLPVLSAEHRKPSTYVVVNKLEPVQKKPLAVSQVAVKPISIPKPVIVEAKHPKFDLKEKILAKKPLLLTKPFVKPISVPKPLLVKKPLDTKNILVPASTIYVQEAPLLPTSYNNPEHVSSALGGLGGPIRAGGAPVPTDVQNIPRLVQASVQAIGNVNSIGQVADALETYNELGGLISRSDGGFVPSAGFATKQVDIDTIREAQKPKAEGHVAKSVPQRSSAPADFKGSAVDPIIVLPTSAPLPSSTSTTTTEKVVEDGKE